MIRKFKPPHFQNMNSQKHNPVSWYLLAKKINKIKINNPLRSIEIIQKIYNLYLNILSLQFKPEKV